MRRRKNCYGRWGMYSFLPNVFLSVMFLVMYISLRHPSSYGSGTGYNTVTSRKSKGIWDYAQKLACYYMRRFFTYSIAYNFVWCIVYFIIKNFEWASSNGLLIFNSMISLIILLSYFICVEYKLKSEIKQGRGCTFHKWSALKAAERFSCEYRYSSLLFI